MRRFISWYAARFPFPHRGLKYFSGLLKQAGLHTTLFRKRLHNGLFMLAGLEDHIQRQIFWYGYYEKKEVLTWESFIKDGTTVMDIGANAGYYSLIAAGRNRNGKVFAFEPAGAQIRLLNQNIQLNRLAQIIIVPAAVGNQKGEASLSIAGPDNSGMSSLLPPQNFSGEVETVPVITIDSWMNGQEIKEVSAVKIDIEGAEMLALEGMKQFLDHYRPPVFVEVLAELLIRFDSSPGDIFDFFTALDYEAFQITGPSQWTKLEVPTERELILFLPEGIQ